MSKYTDFVLEVIKSKVADKAALKAQFDSIKIIYAESVRVDKQKDILDKIISKEEDMKMLNLIVSKFKLYDIQDMEEIECENGFEGCDHDDVESMSDECRQQLAEEHHEGMMDTFGD